LQNKEFYLAFGYKLNHCKNIGLQCPAYEILISPTMPNPVLWMKT